MSTSNSYGNGTRHADDGRDGAQVIWLLALLAALVILASAGAFLSNYNLIGGVRVSANALQASQFQEAVADIESAFCNEGTTRRCTITIKGRHYQIEFGAYHESAPVASGGTPVWFSYERGDEAPLRVLTNEHKVSQEDAVQSVARTVRWLKARAAEEFEEQDKRARNAQTWRR